MVAGRALLVPLALLAAACAGGDGGADEQSAERPVETTASAPSSSTTVAAPTTTTTAPATTTTAAPAGPETVETVIGRSTIRFTYPAGLTPEEREVLDTYHRFLKALWSATDPPNPNERRTRCNSASDEY